MPISDLLARFSALADVGEEKKAAVAAASTEKKVILDQNFGMTLLEEQNKEYAKKIDEQRAVEANNWALHTGSRETSDLLSDGSLTAARTAVGTTGGLAAMLAKYNSTNFGVEAVRALGHVGEALTQDKPVDGSVLGHVAPIVKRILDDPSTGTAGNEGAAALVAATTGTSRFLDAHHSDFSKLNVAHNAELQAIDDAASKAKELGDIQDGQSHFWAGTKRFGRDLRSSLYNTATNPTTLFDEGVGQSATLLLGPLGKLGTLERATAVVEEQVAKKTGDIVSARALMAAEPAPYIKQIKDLAEKKARNQFAGVVGLTEASSAYSDTFQSVMDMSDEDLRDKFPEYVNHMNDPGFNSREFQLKLASSAAGKAALIAGPIGAFSGRIAAAAELHPLSVGEGSLARKTGERFLKTAQEFGEELTQGASGQYAQNQGLSDAGQSNVDLLAGVGAGAGQGAATAGLMTGTLQTPGLAKDLALKGGKVAYSAVKTRLQEIGAEADRQDRANANVAAAQQAADISTNIQTNNETLRANHPIISEAVDALKPATDESSALQASLAPENKIEPVANETENSAFFRQALKGLTDLPHLEGDQRIISAGVLANQIQGAREKLNEVDTYLTQDMEENDPDRVYALKVRAELSTIVDHENVSEISKVFSAVTPEQQKSFQNDLASEDATTRMRGFETIRAMLVSAPDKISPELAQQGLQSEPLNQQTAPLNQDERSQLEMVIEQAQVKQEADTEMTQAITEATKGSDGKSNPRNIAEVRRRVQTQGDFGKKGLTQHVAGIQRALAQGDMALAEEGAKELYTFALNYSHRAKSFADTVDRLKKSGHPFDDVEGTSTFQNGQMRDIPFRLYANNPGSMVVADAVQIDARAAVKAYNHIVNRMPEDSNFQKIDLNALANAPSSTSASTTSATPTPGADVSSDAEGDSGSNEVTRTKQEFVSYFDVPEDVKHQFNGLDKEIGWLERGGFIIRAEVKPNDGFLGQVIGRTKWQPLPGPDGLPSPYWQHRNDKGMTAKRAHEALRKYKLGLRLGPAQKAFIAESLQFAADRVDAASQDSQQAGQDLAAQDAARAAREARTTSEQKPTPDAAASATPAATAPVVEANTTEVAATPAEEKKPDTVETLFPEIKATFVQESGKPNPLQNKNPLVTAFSARKNSTGLLARLGSNPMAKLRELIDRGMEGLRTLMPEGSLMRLSEADQAFLSDLADGVPNIVSLMNGMLKQAPGLQGALEAWTKGEGNAVWLFPNKRTVAATNLDPKDLKYDDNFAQVMATTGLVWVMDALSRGYSSNDEKIAKFFNIKEYEVTPRMREVFRNGVVEQAAASDLARELMSNLGLTAKSSESKTHTDGLPKALAGDIIDVLSTNNRWITRNNIDDIVVNGKVIEFVTITFNKKSKLAGHLEKIGAGWGNIKKLLNPAYEQQWHVGEAPKSREEKVVGTVQKISTAIARVLKNHNNTKFTMNLQFYNELKALGHTAMLERLGYQDIKESDVNVMDWKRIDGTNQGILRSLHAANTMYEQVERYAQEHGITDLSKVPVYFDWYQGVNGRIYMHNSNGPQGNKLMRELLTPVEAELELGNAEHIEDFKLAVAQALGVKTENVTNASAVASVDEWFKDKNSDFRKIVDEINKKKPDQAKIHAAMAKYGEMEVRMMTALYSYAAYERAVGAKDSSFKTSLAFELDGKTDGPINAIGQFGLGGVMDDTLVTNLHRGGMFFGDKSGKTLNVEGAKLGDLYGATGLTLTDKFQAELEKLDKEIAEHPDQTTTEQQVYRAGLIAARAFFIALKKVEKNLEGRLTFNRKFPKTSVTSSGYGGGVSAIVGHLRSDILDMFYREVSAAMKEDREVNSNMAAMLNRMITEEIRYNSKNGVSIEGTTKGFDASNTGAYASFKLSPKQIKNLDSHLYAGLGRLTQESIEDQMQSTMDGMRTVIHASNLQWMVLSKRYEKLYLKLQEKRVAEGKLLDRQALSADDEALLARALRHLIPIFQTAYTEGDNTREVGMGFSETDKRNKFFLPNKKGEMVEQKVASTLRGDVRLGINKTQFKEPKLRAGGLYNMAVGDANMMAAFFRLEQKALNVWDGLEIAAGTIKANAEIINKHVYDGWKYNAFQAVFQNFERVFSLIESEAKEDPEIQSQIVELMDRFKEQKKSASQLLADFMKGFRIKVERTSAVKEAMSELAFSGDHMSGGMRPYTKDGVEVPLENLAAWITKRADEIQRARKQLPITEPADPKLAAAAKAFNNELSRNQIISIMDKYEGFNPVQKYIWNTIKGLLNENLVMHVGNSFDIAKKQAELFPGVKFEKNVGGSYLDNTIFIVSASPETMLHEAVHAATLHLIEDFYNKTGNLNPQQKAAIKDLETLTLAFGDIPIDTEVLNAEHAVKLAQNTVRKYIAEKNMPAAVNEYMAWAVNQNVQGVLNRKMPSTIGKMLQSIVTAVRKLLGLPNNVQANTWLAGALSSFTRLSQSTKDQRASNTQTPTYQTLGTGSATNGHVDHLHTLNSEFADKVRTYVDLHNAGTGNPILTGINFTDVLQGFQDAYFSFSPLEELTLTSIQAAMSMGLRHNARALNLVQGFYEHVVENLKPESFMSDPTTATQDERTVAEAKYHAILGRGTRGRNTAGQTNLLANFVSMALVNEEFRAIVRKMPVPEKGKLGNNLNDILENGASSIFDWFGTIGMGTNKQASIVAAMDNLAYKLILAEKEAERTRPVTALAEANNAVAQQVHKFGQNLTDEFYARVGARGVNNNNSTPNKIMDNFVDTLLLGVAGLTSKQGAGALARKTLSFVNNSNLEVPNWVRELAVEVMGTTDDNEAIHVLINRVKHATAQARQRLRDELPPLVRSKFTLDGGLTPEVWKAIYRGIGRVDAVHLLQHMSIDQIQEMYSNDNTRQAAIAGLESQLSALRNGQEYVRHTMALGQYMATGENRTNVQFLYRNANAISYLPHLGRAMPDHVVAETVADQLATLYAIDALPSDTRTASASAFRDQAGMQYLMAHLQSLSLREEGKTNTQAWNRWKGYVPTGFDPRKRLRLADPVEGLELEKLGYVRVGTYNSDAADVTGLAYYATKAGSQATFNQGAMQTTQNTVQGVDFRTGRTLDPTMGSMIWDAATVSRITRLKKASAAAGTGIGLLPVMDTQGAIVAYERPLETAMQAEHLSQRDDLSESLGRWEGRIVEEQLADQFNSALVQRIHETYLKLSPTQGGEFIAINDPQADQRVKGAWEAIPKPAKMQLEAMFGGKGFPVMVRRDMVNNAIGYRSASVGDIFTGKSDINKDLRKGLETVARDTLGKNAYQYLVTAERVLQGAVSTAKDFIVVRSLTVGFANALANQLQLLVHDISPIQAAKWQSIALNEVTDYKRNIKKIGEITANLVAEKDQNKRDKMERMLDSLNDHNSKMMIAPLIEAGELPSITEGTDEQDEYSPGKDFTKWIEDRTAKLPKGLTEAARWALIAKDTPLYKGLNRFVQYGDFAAKAAVYHQMVNVQKQDPKVALRKISEEFVNYALLPGRSRTYLESIGLTWFLNYKIRIQKILVSNMRDNPLRALMVFTGGAFVGAETLYDAVPWAITSNAFGPAPLLRATDSLAWRRLF